jgi:MYXO-CTERM domain-containing protein
VAFVDDWLERGYDPAAYALTTTWFSTATGEILDADMQLNEIKGSYVECPAAGCVAGGDDIDLENTVTHELGHFFGLAHSDVPQATMFSTARNGDVDKRDLDDDDVAGFCAAYGAGSLGSSCSFTPPGGLELNCEDPGCGCSVPGARSESQAPIAMSILGVVLMWWRRRR